MPDTDLLIKLILAHLIGDFILQREEWVRDKEEKKFRSLSLYLHALIHSVLAMVIVWNWHFWPYAFVLGASHLLIDALKAALPNGQRLLWFLADQALHVVVIVTLWAHHERELLEMDFWLIDISWPVVMGFVFVTWPAAFMIREVIRPFTPDGNIGPRNAGLTIGIIERLLVLVLLINDQWEAVGFLLAAKSVFRFRDLKESKDRHFTEYILIGTLLSFGIAIASGLIVLRLAS